jgi:hypothetical protein
MAVREERVAVQLVVGLLLAGWASAQGTQTTPAQTQPAQTTPQTQPTQTTPAQTQPAQTTPAQTQPAPPPQTQTTNNNQQTNTPNSSPAPAQSTNTGKTGGTVSITGIDTRTTGTPTTTVPAVGGLTDLPTIPGYGIPTIGVPFTGNAPFMDKSTLPEGTVFICVGAILGVMGAAVLVWRGLVAWSLHRSVKRANRKILASDGKLTKNGFGAISMAPSNMSLDHLPTAQKRAQARASTITSASAARKSSLFFSPTAGAGHPSMLSPYNSAPNRSSSYLPAGYYTAPGAAAPGSAHIGSGTSRAQYGRYSQFQPSPPGSPALPPSRGGASSVYLQPSMSSLNLHLPGNQQPGGRAPSANMDELFGNDPNAVLRR